MTRSALLIPLLLIFAGLSYFISGCADDPASLGQNFISPDDTTGLKTYDSYSDTLHASMRNLKKPVNTYASPTLIVGSKDNHTSTGLVKFYSLNSNHDSGKVIASELRLRYRNYYFPSSPSDSLGTVSFAVNRIEKSTNFFTVTLDSITPGHYSTAEYGSFSGALTHDSETVVIQLDTGLVRSWLENAADTGYAVKNYGIALRPDMSSNVLKGFYAANASEGLRPELYYIIQKGGTTDTVLHRTVETVYLANSDIAPVPGRFFLQSGVSYFEIMKVFMDRIHEIEATATINDARIIFTPDHSLSIYQPGSDRRINANFIVDTAKLDIETFDFTADTTADGKYTLRIISPVQRWLINSSVNNGLLIAPFDLISNLNLYAFHAMDSEVPDKRPRLIIRYTPRIINDNTIKEKEVIIDVQ